MVFFVRRQLMVSPKESPLGSVFCFAYTPCVADLALTLFLLTLRDEVCGTGRRFTDQGELQWRQS
jgi:hypothetical protein